MAVFKSILLRVEVRPAGRRCQCKHSRSHQIAKGQPRLAIKEPGPGTPETGYCRDCALIMLDRAAEVIDTLRGQLRSAED
jgi:hypothetical protein